MSERSLSIGISLGVWISKYLMVVPVFYVDDRPFSSIADIAVAVLLLVGFAAIVVLSRTAAADVFALGNEFETASAEIRVSDTNIEEMVSDTLTSPPIGLLDDTVYSYPATARGNSEGE